MNIKKYVKKMLSDKLVIKYKYYKKFGEKLNLKNPTTFSEKVQWIKIYGNLEKATCLIDKYEVRNYIENKIGKSYLNKIYGVYTDIDQIKFEDLPNRFVLKNTNGSGYNYICTDKSKIDVNEVKDILNGWLNINYYGINGEIQYKNCVNRILIEEYIEDKEGKLNDYKFFCLGGKVRVIEVDLNRGSNLKRDFYNCDWEKLNLKKGVENSDLIIKKPEKLEKMIELAEILSENIELLRVDFYYVDNKIYFGELTFTPANGFTAFYPKNEDLRLASYVDLSKYDLGVLDEY